MGASRTRAGSFDELISAYYPSTLFSNRAPGTRKNRRIALEGFRKAHGTKPVAHLRTDLLAQIIDQKAKATPGAARDMLCALRELYKFAKLHGYASIDPTTGIPLPEIHSEGHYSWEDADIETYRAAHPLGTVARLALEILVNTGLRRIDAVEIGRDHVRPDGKMRIRPQKTKRKDIWVVIPMHPDLKAALDAAPRSLRHQNWLVKKTDGPFSVEYFGDCFQRWVAEAGLPAKCTPHGLRYAIVRRLADLGVRAEDICTVTGHTDLKTVMKYAKGRDRELAAERAMNALI